jgi:hypothetical protein
MILALGLVLLATPIAFNWTYSQDVTADETPTVEEALTALTWVEIDSVELDETADCETMLVIRYVSREFNLVAYRAEMLEVFRAVGALALDEATQVRLIPMADMGTGPQGIETATIDVATLLTYAVGETTRTTFLEEAVIAPLEHGEGAEDQAPA